MKFRPNVERLEVRENPSATLTPDVPLPDPIPPLPPLPMLPPIPQPADPPKPAPGGPGGLI